MTSAPLPLPRCGGRRLGFGAVMLMSLVIFGMALLPPVSGRGVVNISCSFSSGSEPCDNWDHKYCCFSFRFLKYDIYGCHSYGYCPENGKDECMWKNKTHVECMCGSDNYCNKDESIWENDKVYKKFYASTARPNGSNMAVISVLLVVVTVLGSLPLLITALF